MLDPSLEHQTGKRVNSNLRGIARANMLELRFAIVGLNPYLPLNKREYTETESFRAMP